MNQEWYDPNNVTADNFNETMNGYFKRAIKEMKEGLIEKGYTQEQLEEIKKYLNWGIEGAIDMMTMENAREYNNKN